MTKRHSRRQNQDRRVKLDRDNPYRCLTEVEIRRIDEIIRRYQPTWYTDGEFRLEDLPESAPAIDGATAKQLGYLHVLGYRGQQNITKQEASQLITGFLKEKHDL